MSTQGIKKVLLFDVLGAGSAGDFSNTPGVRLNKVTKLAFLDARLVMVQWDLIPSGTAANTDWVIDVDILAEGALAPIVAGHAHFFPPPSQDGTLALTNGAIGAATEISGEYQGDNSMGQWPLIPRQWIQVGVTPTGGGPSYIDDPDIRARVYGLFEKRDP